MLQHVNTVLIGSNCPASYTNLAALSTGDVALFDENKKLLTTTGAAAAAKSIYIGVVKGTERRGGIYVETNGEMSLNGWDEMAAHSQVIYMTEEDFITYEDPPNSGLYPSFINRLVVIQPV